MDRTKPIVFTAIFLKNGYGYTGYVAELPGVNSHGRTIEEARESLRQLVALVFEEERRSVAEILAGKEVQREAFFLPASLHDIESACRAIANPAYCTGARTSH